MTETPVSLLERLRLQPDAESWQRLVRLYTPLLETWLTRYQVPRADADDLIQEVLSVLVRELSTFQHDLRTGSFRRWLRNILVNRLRHFWRARPKVPLPAESCGLGEMLNRLEDPMSDLARQWDQEHDRFVLRRLLEILEGEFEPTTWQAFRLVAMEGVATAAAAEEIGLSVIAVRVAKSRVLKRLRREAEGLVP